jgi:hypothetical protein
MQISHHTARLSKMDIEDLERASEKIAGVAAVIQRANPQWTAIAVAHLIEANEIICRIQSKGVRSVQRFLARLGLTPDGGETTSASDAPEVEALAQTPRAEEDGSGIVADSHSLPRAMRGAD